MRLNIEITKRSLLIICTVIILCSGIIVYAWNSNTPSLMGHTGNEIESLTFSKITPGITNLQGGTLEIQNGSLKTNLFNLDGKDVFIKEKIHKTSCEWNGTNCITDDGYTFDTCGDYNYNLIIEQQTNNPCSSASTQTLCAISFPFEARYSVLCLGIDIPA